MQVDSIVLRKNEWLPVHSPQQTVLQKKTACLKVYGTVVENCLHQWQAYMAYITTGYRWVLRYIVIDNNYYHSIKHTN